MPKPTPTPVPNTTRRRPPARRAAAAVLLAAAALLAGAAVAAPRGAAAQRVTPPVAEPAARLAAARPPAPADRPAADAAPADRALPAAAAGAAGAAPAAAPSLLAFWAQVGDPALERLVGDALAANQEVRAARARIARARAARQLRTFDLAPTVTLSTGLTRRRLSAAQFPGLPRAFREQSLYDAGLDAAWEVDVFGRTRRAVAAERALEGAAGEGLRDAQVAVAAEVARTYYDWRGARRELAVAERNAGNQRRTRQLTLDRLAAGRGTGLDRERAEAQLSGTLAAVPQLEARASAALYRLGVLVARDPAAVVAVLARADAATVRPAARREPPAAAAGGAFGDGPPAAAWAPAAWPATPDSAALAALVERRPDVQGAARQLAARAALVGAARADYLPRVTVVAGVGRNAGAVDGLRSGDAVRYSVGPALTWAAFDLGRVRSRVDAARADAEEARARLTQTRLVALQEAGTAWTAFDRARARLAALAQAAGASDRGAGLARLRFTGGAAGFLDVLDAERAQLDAERQLAAGETEVAAAAATLYEALGGAWAAGGSAGGAP